MSGQLSPDPESAVSARYYGAVTTEHPGRLRLIPPRFVVPQAFPRE